MYVSVCIVRCQPSPNTKQQQQQCVALEFVVSVTSLPHFEIDNKPNKIINVKAKQKVLTISKQ